MKINTIVHGKCLEVLKKIPSETVHQVITSQPYWNLRDYDIGPDALGNEINPYDYINSVVNVTREIHRILKKDGNFILNLGDRFYGNNGLHRGNIKKYKRTSHTHFSKMPLLKKVDNYRQPKQLLLLPFRVVAKMQEDSWMIRNYYTWEKPNAAPNIARDRSRTIKEAIFLCVKSEKYFCNTIAMNENLPTDVIKCPIGKHKNHHPASFPEKIVEPFILSFSRPEDLILDPFCGSGTVPAVAKRLGRDFFGIDLSKDYCMISRERTK